MPSRQQCLSSLISRVTAPTACVFYRCMCGCGALKKDVCTAKATEAGVSSRHYCMHGTLKGVNATSQTTLFVGKVR
jgi:hypothetical protein